MHAVPQMPSTYNWSQCLGPVRSLWGATNPLSAGAAGVKVLQHPPAHGTMHDVRKAREGRGSPPNDGGEQPSVVSTSEFRDIWEKETAVETRGLARGPEAAGGVSVWPSVDIPEEPAPSKTLAVPIRREPMLQEGKPSGERGPGRRVLERFGSVEKLFSWSSPREGSSEEEWETGDSLSVDTPSNAVEEPQSPVGMSFELESNSRST